MNIRNLAKQSAFLGAVCRPRADASDLDGEIGAIMAAFRAYHAEATMQGADLHKLKADMDDLSSRLAALAVNGSAVDLGSAGGLPKITAEERKALSAYMRNGIKAEMTVGSDPSGGYMVPEKHRPVRSEHAACVFADAQLGAHFHHL